MVDDRTPGMGLALPHPGNRLQEDVLRLRQSLAAVDSACETLAGILATKVDAQELAVAIAGLQGSLNNLGATVAFLTNTKVGVVNGLPGPAVSLKPEHLGLGPANGPSLQTIARDAQGRIESVSTTTGGKVAMQVLGYDAQGRVSVVTTTYDGHRRTETLNYNAAGLVSVEATEAIL